jgi:TRAP-type mannitol/chloroaromatic compound transport system permease small subunit
LVAVTLNATLGIGVAWLVLLGVVVGVADESHAANRHSQQPNTNHAMDVQCFLLATFIVYLSS